jgi:hypothetical protein
MKLVQHVLGGAAVFGAAVWGGFSWAKSGQQREAVVVAGKQRSGAAAHGGRSGGCGDGTSDDGCCAFDRLADAYDGIVGAEERGMFMGLLRWWLLRDAEVRLRAGWLGGGRQGSTCGREACRRWHSTAEPADSHAAAEGRVVWSPGPWSC